MRLSYKYDMKEFVHNNQLKVCNCVCVCKGIPRKRKTRGSVQRAVAICQVTGDFSSYFFLGFPNFSQ